MKKILVYVVLVSFLLHFVACNDKYMFFDEDFASIRFNNASHLKDSVVYSFALKPGVEVDTIAIPLRLIGFTSNQSRLVSIGVNYELTTASEGVDYLLEPCELLPDKVSTDLNIIVKRSKKLEESNLKLSIYLEDNSFFHNPPIGEDVYEIILTNKLTRPSDWRNEFGVYSLVKHEFIIKVTNKGTNYNEWTGQQLIYYLGLLNQALYEYNKEHPGKPLEDEFGVLVTF